MKKQIPQKSPKAAVVKATKSHVWLWFSFFIVVLTGILYINTLQNGYALDDKGIITANTFTMKGFAGIPDLLTSSYWKGVGINVRSYRPLAPVTFAAEVGLWGANPATGHFFNLLFYMVTGLILLFFLKRLFEMTDPKIPPAVPFIVAALFVAHPIHTEVVANIKGRDSMFELLFILLSANYLLKYISAGKPADLIRSVALYFPALLSKESAVTYVVMVPVILVLYDDRPLVKKAGTSLFYLVPVALFLLLYYRFSELEGFTKLHLLDNALISDAPAGDIWATKFLILGSYLKLLIWPHPLLYDYSYNTIPLTTFANPLVWISLLIYLGALVFLVSILLKKFAGKTVNPGNKLTAFSIALFFMGFFASSNLVMLIGSTMGERFMYIPSLGFLLMVVYGLYRLSLFAAKGRKFTPQVSALLFISTGLTLAGYLYGTIDRNKDWKDDMTLFSADMENLSENTKANDFLGTLYKKEGDAATDPAVRSENYKKAIIYLEKSVDIYPKVPEIQQRLAFVYGNTGQFEKSIETYKIAVELNPGEVMNYVQIGKAYGMVSRAREGLAYLEKGEKIDPGNVDILSTLGIGYAQTGQVEKAISYFEKALAKDPSNTQIAGYLSYARKQADASAGVKKNK